MNKISGIENFKKFPKKLKFALMLSGIASFGTAISLLVGLFFIPTNTNPPFNPNVEALTHGIYATLFWLSLIPIFIFNYNQNSKTINVLLYIITTISGLIIGVFLFHYGKKELINISN